MGYFIAGIVCFCAYALVSMYTIDDNKDWGWLLNVFLVIVSVAFVMQVAYNNHKWHTEIVHCYKSGDYSLEVRIDGDKVDTLYIFK